MDQDGDHGRMKKMCCSNVKFNERGSKQEGGGSGRGGVVLGRGGGGSGAAADGGPVGGGGGGGPISNGLGGGDDYPDDSGEGSGDDDPSSDTISDSDTAGTSDGSGDDELNSEAGVHRPPRGSSSSGCAVRPTRRKVNAKPADFQNLSGAGWDVRQHRDGSDFATMKWTKSGEEYTVSYSRVPKARLHLTPDSFLEPMREDSCTCKGRKCCGVLSTTAIKEIRTQVYTQCHDEASLRNYLFGKLQSTRGRIQLHGKDVCRLYFAKVHSVSPNRVSRFKKIVASGRQLPALRRTIQRRRCMRDARNPPKSGVAYAFWHMFFESNCQRPNAEVRLWPVYKTFKEVYSDYFNPWFARLVKQGTYTEAARPKFSTFKGARRHPDFKDVVDRPEHYHARCETCRNLSTLLLNAFADGAAEEDYRRQRDAHDAEVAAWRNFESVTEANAASHPDKVRL